MILSEDPPISVLHPLKRLILPRTHAFSRQDVFVSIVGQLGKNGDESLTCVFLLVPFKQQLTSVLHIPPLRQLHFGQPKHFTLHLVSLLRIIL